MEIFTSSYPYQCKIGQNPVSNDQKELIPGIPLAQGFRTFLPLPSLSFVAAPRTLLPSFSFSTYHGKKSRDDASVDHLTVYEQNIR